MVCQNITSRLANVSISSSKHDDTSVAKSAAKKLLDFKYVVLDEAGAMLEPDMVVSILEMPCMNAQVLLMYLAPHGHLSTTLQSVSVVVHI